MARPKRFELLAYRFVACCSIQLSYERVRTFLAESPPPVKRPGAFSAVGKFFGNAALSPQKTLAKGGALAYKKQVGTERCPSWSKEHDWKSCVR